MGTMSIEALHKEPASIYAGDTINWQISLPDFPASAGWTLKYNAVSPKGQFALASSPLGSDHSISAAKSATAAFVPGTYTLTRYVESADERVTLDQMTLQVLPDLAGKTAPFDNRSHARRTLDLIEAVIEGRASRSDFELQIDFGGTSRRVKHLTAAELLKVRGHYSALVWREENPGKIGPSVTVTFPRDRYRGPWQN